VPARGVAVGKGVEVATGEGNREGETIAGGALATPHPTRTKLRTRAPIAPRDRFIAG